MSKRNYGLTEDKIMEYLKKGYGEGCGSDYKPWLEVQDFPSKGRVSRCFSWKTKRTHHFMSDLETRYFYFLLWSNKVVDIREQFPLLERDKTIKIAETKGIKYPADPKSKVPIVLTTDFLITENNKGKLTNVARTIKPSKDLDNPRVIEKFEIERSYWEEEGIDWGIVTENEISKVMSLNIEWAYSAYSLEGNGELTTDNLLEYAELLKVKLSKNNQPLYTLLDKLDDEINLEKGTFLYLFKHLIATKHIELVNINEKINLRKSVNELIQQVN